MKGGNVEHYVKVFNMTMLPCSYQCTLLSKSVRFQSKWIHMFHYARELA